MLTKQEISKKRANKEIKRLEEKLWLDIVGVRRSLDVIDHFLYKLSRRSSDHFYNKDAPIANAIYAASMDSVIIGLGRILNSNAKEDECTLSKYRNQVIRYIKEYGSDRSESDLSKQNFIKLSNDREFLRSMKEKQKDYEKTIKPWRDNVIAHSNMSDLPEFPKNFKEIILFIEDTHRVLHSAMEDAGIVGEYSSKNLKDSAENWIEALISREKVI